MRFLLSLGVVLIATAVPWAQSQTAVDPEPRVAFSLNPQQRFGIKVVKDAQGKPVAKELTYSTSGDTNNAIIKIDAKPLPLYGAGTWREKSVKVAGQPHAVRSVWQAEGIEVSQILDIVPSKQPVEIAPGIQKRLLDTVLIRYEIHNQQAKSHTAGLRLMIDTQIGGNDGVPFTVPGLGLIDTHKDFASAKEVPDFLQALERPDLKNPGTVGHLTLRIPALEAPGRVSLTYWPGAQAPWEVPLRSIKQGRPDSAIVLYWQERELGAGQKRTLGIAYGLGNFSGAEGTGHLAVIVDGVFEVGKLFTLTAYVDDPKAGETLDLVLPGELELAQGKQQEPVPPLAAGTKHSIVSWKLKSLAAGKFALKVRASSGQEAVKDVTIAPAENKVDITPPTKPQPPKTPTVPGELSVLDAQRALKMSVRLLEEELMLDIDTDGRVTSRDAVQILQRAAAKATK